MDGAGLRVGIVHTRWHLNLVEMARGRCRDALLACGVLDEDVIVLEVPGAWELPYGVSHLGKTATVDVIIPLGCLIKGSTMHFEYISEAVSQGFMHVQRDLGIPVVNGVLNVFSLEQAEERVSEDGHDHGYEWGLAAVEMGRLKKAGS